MSSTTTPTTSSSSPSSSSSSNTTATATATATATPTCGREVAPVPPSPPNWTNRHVCAWLTQLGVAKHVRVFAVTKVNGRELLSMSQEQLEAPPYSLPAELAAKIVDSLTTQCASVVSDIFDTLLASTEQADDDDIFTPLYELSDSDDDMLALHAGLPPSATPSSSSSTTPPSSKRPPSASLNPTTPAQPTTQQWRHVDACRSPTSGRRFSLRDNSPRPEGLKTSRELCKMTGPQPPKEYVHHMPSLIKFIHNMDGASWDHNTIDYWSSMHSPVASWVANATVDVLTNGMPLIDPKVKTFNFNLELGRNSVSNCSRIDPSMLVEAHLDCKFYAEFLAPSSHKTYVGQQGDCPYVITFEIPVSKDNSCKKAFIRTKHEDKRVLVQANERPRNLIPQLLVTHFNAHDIQFVKVVDPNLPHELVEFESRNTVRAYKFGLLYCTPFQHVEDEIYSNCSTSPQYEEFLRFLGNGEPINLKGWNKFRGGLDVKNNVSGEQSVYTEFRGYEIMFHVATMLPFVDTDRQRIERKRHVGNDVVVIIFKERGDDMDCFNPKILASHFNHCFFVIQAETDAQGRTTHYRLSIGNKEGVPPYPPFLPSPPIFEKNSDFRDFLLLKLINAERAAMNAREFKAKIEKARRVLLQQIVNKYTTKPTKPTKT
ncbi:GTPaseactivating protein [Pelomyxa schiedti]|nr:GTPaseactivating protein [Pelomyxa schiedti]